MIKISQYFLLIIFLSGVSCNTANPSKTGYLKKETETEQQKKITKPKNVILLIGDGMGISQITAALFENNNKLNLERCPVVGLHKPYASNDLILDSAAGATAFSCGQKTHNLYLGLDSSGNVCVTILEEVIKKGLKTGLVVSSTIVHATPAAFFSHRKSRHEYEGIAMDLLNTDVDFIVGGGKKYFDQRTTDSLVLSQKFTEKGYLVRDYFDQNYNDWTIPDVHKLLYFSAEGDPLPVSKGRDYLPKATKDAIQFLNRKNAKGFFLMVEGSQIDWGGHANDSKYIIDEMLDFDNAIKEALDFAEKDKNTLVIITSDHETGGFSITNGKLFGSLQTKFTTKHHTAQLIPTFAFGPGAQKFSGIYENTYIHTLISSLLLH